MGRSSRRGAGRQVRLLRCEWEKDLHIIDVSDPAGSFEAGFYETSSEGVDVAVAGSRAYVADWDAGLMILRFVPPQTIYLPLVLR